MPTVERTTIALAVLMLLACSPTAAEDVFGLFPECRFAAPESPEGGEEEDEIETDRDSFTLATGVVGDRHLVLEAAYSFVDNRRVPETHSLPELIARYGIGDRFELRFGYNYEVGGAGNPISGNVPDEFEETTDLERGSRVIYGAKWQVSHQRGWKPESSVAIDAYTPLTGIDTATQLSTTYVFGWANRTDWKWDSAIRFGTGAFEDDSFNIWSPSTVVKFPLGENWEGHVEYFSVNTDGRVSESSQHFISPGTHYLINPNLEVGIRVGWGLNQQAPGFFSNIGTGLRF
ncbi:transporter [Allorhodopirellula solitaria]|uniref:MetA-pathway of phenol degradation n=1 Tax=Allorhodopirellula solitaria TaxID=2527987 RepID=A0A5C5XUW4_9BACT|nr:transporter [Allorhodopirellula solitaria]TWT67067.1 hypothetical protein CA85_19130 [Allorhodopirellula solitaria]